MIHVHVVKGVASRLLTTVQDVTPNKQQQQHEPHLLQPCMQKVWQYVDI
jgi:hypothetical protein